jgi:hypothetical protein
VLLASSLAGPSFSDEPAFDDFEVRLDEIHGRVSADLDENARALIDALARSAFDEQVAVLQDQSDERLALAIAGQVHAYLATHARETLRLARAEAGAVDREVSIWAERIQSGSLALPGCPSRPPVDLRVVRVDEAGFDYELRKAGNAPPQDASARLPSPPASAR